MNINLKKKEEKEKETTKANVTIAPKSTHSILFEYNIYIKTLLVLVVIGFLLVFFDK